MLPKTIPLSSRKHITVLLLAILLLICVENTRAQNIEIDFTGIRSPKGQIIVKIFSDEKSFQDDKAMKALKFRKSGIAGGALKGKCSLEPGTYGFALLDDENDNGVMEYNFIGMPKEGFGFSDFYLTGMKKPKFEQFKFTVRKDEHKKISMKLRYL